MYQNEDEATYQAYRGFENLKMCSLPLSHLQSDQNGKAK